MPSEFEEPAEQGFGIKFPKSTPEATQERVLNYGRSARPWCFAFAALCVCAVIVLHVFEFNIERNCFELSTKWGPIKGGVSALMIGLAGYSIHRGTELVITQDHPRRRASLPRK